MSECDTAVQILFGVIVLAFGFGLGLGSMDWTGLYPIEPMAALGAWAWIFMTAGGLYAFGVGMGEHLTLNRIQEAGWGPAQEDNTEQTKQ